MRILHAAQRKTFSPPNSPAQVQILAGAGPEHGGLEKHTVARVTLPAGKALEKHFHSVREETYVVVSGTGRAVVGDEDIALQPGDTLTVFPGEHHALKADATTSLEYFVVTAPAWAADDVHPCC
jgi:mannose-6-phosphate isomerase-like protein (cupin superfamily)